jgi:hypothetical protein
MANPVSLIVRFATGIQDIPLTIASPSTTAVAHVKRQIRAYLPEEERKHGLRLIYSGRILEGRSSLASALGLPAQHDPPSLSPNDASDAASRSSLLSSNQAQPKVKGKGKAPPTDTPPVYIHCAISSFALSQADLAAELQSPSQEDVPSSKAGTTTGSQGTITPSTRPQGRGFDRLFSSQGFTRSDVAELRAQHTAMISSRYTPDTMPSQEALLDMEEAWLGEGTSSTASGAAAGLASASTTADEDEQGRMLADTLYGAMMGFFWPVGALAWGFKEEGVWSKRRKEMVLLGLLLNGVFGVMSMLSL